jgi:ligand-binding sensor domain-containing protein
MTLPNSGYKASYISLFVFFCSLWPGSSVHGQNEAEDITFAKVSIPGVIRSAQVSDIIQDNDGTLWINANGLYRYDGFKFTFYKDVVDSKVKLTGKEISALYYDSAMQRIMIATRNFGLMQYNYSTNTITKLVEQKGIPTINQLTRTSDGRLWADPHK